VDITAPFRKQIEQLQRTPRVMGPLLKLKRTAPQ
jgi:hypothetical protein